MSHFLKVNDDQVLTTFDLIDSFTFFIFQLNNTFSSENFNIKRYELSLLSFVDFKPDEPV